MFDIYKSHCKLAVSGNYGSTHTSVLISGANLVSRLPMSGSGIFSVVWYNETDYPSVYDDPYKEICRVTGFSGQTLFLERGREYTNPAYHSGTNKVHKMIATPTARGFNNLFFFRNPEKAYYYFEDFLLPFADIKGWETTSLAPDIGAQSIYSSNQQFGMWTMSPGNSAGTYAAAMIGFNGYLLGSGLMAVECLWRPVNIPNTGNDFWHYIGFGDSLTTPDTSVVDGLAFLISSGSANWQVFRATNSVRTTQATSIPITTGWHKLNIVVDAGGVIADFYVDDIYAGNFSGNLPTGASHTTAFQLAAYRKTATTAPYASLNGTGNVDYLMIYKEMQPLNSFSATGYNWRV